MATVLSAPEFQTTSHSAARTRVAIAGVLTVWLVAIVVLGVTGALASPPGRPPLPIGIGFAAPLVLFFASLRLSRSFREFVLSVDLRLITGLQAWRFAGLGLLALYTHKILPGGFALPAGLGDMAIGLTAPWVAATLTRQPSFAASGRFRLWTALGMLDLVGAIADGALNMVHATGDPGQINTGAMAQLPLALLPVYLVPIFFMLHVTSLLQSTAAAGKPALLAHRS
jgi:hypothetical protein